MVDGAAGLHHVLAAAYADMADLMPDIALPTGLEEPERGAEHQG
jgi:hypothetical protein